MNYQPDNKKAPAPTTTQDALITNTTKPDYPTKGSSAKYLLVNAGFIVQSVQDGGFNVVRTDWGQCHYCKDDAELEVFAKKVRIAI